MINTRSLLENSLVILRPSTGDPATQYKNGTMTKKKEYGDFQTPERLAVASVDLVAKLFGTPDVVIEPMAGLGTFLKASFQQWGNCAKYRGYEINKEYVDAARQHLNTFDVEVLHRDFFDEDWFQNLAQFGDSRLLVIGNPPWVTNSDLGQIKSENLPKKSNFQKLRGFDARTGKSNFDIAEWMLIRLIEAIPASGAIAMLCKTSTARKVLRHFWRTRGGLKNSRLFHFDAKAEFNVSVDACLFYATGIQTNKRVATIHREFSLESMSSGLGFIEGDLVSDVEAYTGLKHLDGSSSPYMWRSGMKHDASKVMEFSIEGQTLVNGFGETVDIEKEYVFPLLKSSDLAKNADVPRKCVLVTQTHTGDDTSVIAERAPRTWQYLLMNAMVLDGRKSSIYKNRSRFAVFGVGPYSFSPWKIAISGLYKKVSFALVSPYHNRPVMLDDTCYSIPCQSSDEASLLYDLLSSETASRFLYSLVFLDSKRPITADVLRRLSLMELARDVGRLDEFLEYAQPHQSGEQGAPASGTIASSAGLFALQ